MRDVDLLLRHSEIFGLAGVEGNGQVELVEALVGLRRPDGGSVYLDNDELTREDVRSRREKGLAYIPEDRHARGMVLQMGLWENSVLGQQEREPFSRRGILFPKAMKARAAELIERFRVKATSVLEPGLRAVRGQPAEAGAGPGVRRPAQAAHRRPPDPRPGHRRHRVRLAGSWSTPATPAWPCC